MPLREIGRMAKLGVVGAVCGLLMFFADPVAMVSVIAFFFVVFIGPVTILFPARWRDEIPIDVWMRFAWSYGSVGILMAIAPAFTTHFPEVALPLIGMVTGVGLWVSRRIAIGKAPRPKLWEYLAACLFVAFAIPAYLDSPNRVLEVALLQGLAGFGSARMVAGWLHPKQANEFLSRRVGGPAE